MSRHTDVLLALAAVATLAVPAVAVAQDRPEGGLGISPARRDVTARPPTAIAPTAVSNTTGQVFRLRIYPALLGQSLDGSFDIRTEPEALRRAARLYSLSQERATLAPGEELAVAERWRRLPEGLRGVAIGFVVEGRPDQPADQPVQAITRLVGLRFAKLPGDRGVSGRFAGLRVEEVEGPKLRLFARVRNTGRVFAEPEATRLVITNAGGRVVLRKRWPSGMVLVDAEREFPIDVGKDLPAGVYRATARMRFGDRRRRISHRFRLVDTNRLPTVRFRLSGVQVRGEAGSRAELTAIVTNTGTAAAAPRLTLRLFGMRGGRRSPSPVAERTLALPTIRPDAAREVSEVVGDRLRPGDYRLQVVLRAAGRRMAQETADLQVTTSPGFFEGLWDTLRWALLALVLMAVGGLGALAALRRRGRLVDLNRATPGELARLPGVGPAAAERIVAHRQEYGDFASAEDLLRVDGFDEDRVRALADRIRV